MRVKALSTHCIAVEDSLAIAHPDGTTRYYYFRAHLNILEFIYYAADWTHRRDEIHRRA